ncbi:MAG: hypothetical protein KatS3mg087_1159 [Patescibacteria group bacterium]|nr:MAG: hypothetical protein KatS3mg087_1159 [Patescibacteria group bacterium]
MITTAELAQELSQYPALGHIISWNFPHGIKHEYDKITEALEKNGLDSKLVKKMLPRNAFSRAMRSMKADRVIDIVNEDDKYIKFQFTRKFFADNEWEFQKECFLELNKITGEITCANKNLQQAAQTKLNEEMEIRYNGDITQIVHKLMQVSADLIPIRDKGGVYFVPIIYKEYVEKIYNFLESLGGKVVIIPVPDGSKIAGSSIQGVVEDSIERLIDDYKAQINKLNESTRTKTIKGIADQIKSARTKIEAYAVYLEDRKALLEQKLAEADKLLKEKVEEIGGGKDSKYDWERIFDGSIWVLEQGTDFDCKPGSFAIVARIAAKKHGVKLKIKIDDAKVYIKAVK